MWTPPPMCALLAACIGYNLLSFPPAINLNKSLQIPLLTLPFGVSACVLQNHSMSENSQHVFFFCRISHCPSTASFLTTHDTLIPSPALPCTVNTLHCYGLSETMDVGQRAEGCGWMPQHRPMEKKPAVTLSASALWKESSTTGIWQNYTVLYIFLCS